MGQEVAKIKKRIKSVTGAYKVTSAMKLVSTVKLRSYRNKMSANRDYNDTLKEILDTLFSNLENVTSSFTKENNSNKNLYIIISSTLGLCGSYNQNVFKEVDVNLNKDDDAIILGKKALIHYSSGTFNNIEGFEDYSSIQDEGIIRNISEYVISKYEKGVYKNVFIIYTHYINPLVFKAQLFRLLPLVEQEGESKLIEPIYEPNKASLIESLTPFYIQSTVYSKILESEVCEHASRSNAMDNATKNAEELLDNLKIEFNKARQGAITQEIIEITSASNMNK